jgi:hypothetical protein
LSERITLINTALIVEKEKNGKKDSQISQKEAKSIYSVITTASSIKKIDSANTCTVLKVHS